MANAGSIRRRVTFTALSLFVASLTILGVFTYRDQLHQLQEGFKDLAQNDNRLFHAMLKADGEGLARAHVGLGRLDPLLSLFASDSKEPLLAAAAPIFADMKAHNNITHMYFIRPDGTVLLRVHKPEQSGDKLARATFLKASSTKALVYGLEMGKNFFSLRCVIPASFKGRQIGYLEVAEEIDHIFKQMKEVNGDDEALFLTDKFLASMSTEVKSERVGTFSILYPTDKARTLKLAAKILPAMETALTGAEVTVVNLDGAKYLVGLSPIQDASGTTVGVLFSQKDVTPLFSAMWHRVLGDILILGVMMSAAALLLYLSLAKSLALFKEVREHIVRVTTTWDLTRPLKVETKDEIGVLAADVNVMTAKLAEMVAKVNGSSHELTRVSSSIQDVAGQVTTAAERQAVAVNETSMALGNIDVSIQALSEGAERLSHATAESTSSILELTASVEEVAASAESLMLSVDEVSSSIGEMSASVNQVKGNAASLMETATVTASSIMEMDSTIKQVERNARDTAAISEGVRRDAETGKEAVEATISGMGEIKASSRITAEVIETLSERAHNIGNIVSVINDVADQTNLLSLNAAIIAAQAGAHGKGFAVVAEEIKKLAERTRTSTSEIADVISGVRDEIARAVKAIDQAERSIERGETLSHRSGEALRKVVEGVQSATAQVESIARATTEQAKGSQMIREAMEQVADMVRQIATATSEQGHGSTLIMTAVARMTDLTAQVRDATRKQSCAGALISEATERISAMIKQFEHACEEQKRGSGQIAPAVANISQATESNLDAVWTLDSNLKDLVSQIEVLSAEISRFNAGD